MSSYNENLHSSVVSSLSAQELELQKVKAKLDASMFSLYYAQSARISTAEKLDLTTKKYKVQQQTQGQIIIDSDISTNVLQSANNVKSYTDKSVSNTAVAAANVQIASNAILKLASDTGSIFSIINAADYGTEIYTQSLQATTLMNETAYLAEKTSQYSMESSAYIAEVTTGAYTDKANTTDASIKDLASVLKTQFDDTTTMLSTESSELADANTKEKKAEGKLEDLTVAYTAALQAYQLSNRELNLALNVKTPDSIVGEHNTFSVSFKVYESPFTPKEKATKGSENSDGTSNTANDSNTVNPVEDYYIMLVKESKSATFGINNAEGLITEKESSRYVKPTAEDIKNGKVSTQISIKPNESNIPVLVDTDGDPFEKGTEYVVYVLVVLTSAYKKIINTFDDYLSAPSKMFTLKDKLNSVSPLSIEIPTKTSNVLSFGILENPAYKVQYRCLFLPHDPELVEGLLTTEELQQLHDEVEAQKRKSQEDLNMLNLYDDMIKSLETKLYDLQNPSEANTNTDADAGAGAGAKETAASTADAKKEKAPASKKTRKKTPSQSADDTKKIQTLSANIVKLQNKKAEFLNNNESYTKPGFFFNLTIAEQVPAGSYSTAIDNTESGEAALLKNVDTIIGDNNSAAATKFKTEIKSLIKNGDEKQFAAGATKLIQDLLENNEDEKLFGYIEYLYALIHDLRNIDRGYTYTHKSVELKAETTDNFGNRLVKGNEYIPVVISISDNDDEQKDAMFTNAISNYHLTPIFTYS